MAAVPDGKGTRPTEGASRLERYVLPRQKKTDYAEEYGRYGEGVHDGRGRRV